MKKLGCVNVHPGNFIRHLTDFSTWSELKYEKARMHNVHPGFSILPLTDISTSSKLQDEKARCKMCILVFLTSFSSLISALKDKKAMMHNMHPSFFFLQLTDFSAEG